MASACRPVKIMEDEGQRQNYMDRIQQLHLNFHQEQPPYRKIHNLYDDLRAKVIFFLILPFHCFLLTLLFILFCIILFSSHSTRGCFYELLFFPMWGWTQLHCVICFRSDGSTDWSLISTEVMENLADQCAILLPVELEFAISYDLSIFLKS